MGSSLSTSSEGGHAGKAYVLPVVLPPHMVHSSNSTSTLNSDEGSSSSSSSRVDPDQEMLKHVLQTYEYKGVLGKGSSAQVLEVAHKVTGETFACKVVRKNRSFNDDRTMSTETEIMKRMQHRNVLRLHELYETSTARWFVMEFANAGSLQQALSSEENYSETLVAAAFKQILEGVLYLHSIGIVHRDLKQDNILCRVNTAADGSRQYEVKVADFGLSAVLDVKTAEKYSKSAKAMKSARKLKDMWGTREYFAPEVYQKAYGPQVDVWALGCVLYELLIGEAPFPVREKQPSAVDRYLLNGGRKIARAFELRPGWQALSAEARDLISRMLKVNPRKRLSIAECLEHPFITGQLLSAQSEAVSAAVGRTFPVLGVVQVPVGAAAGEFADISDDSSHLTSGAAKAKSARAAVLYQARDTAFRMAELNRRKLQFLAAQLERERERTVQ